MKTYNLGEEEEMMMEDEDMEIEEEQVFVAHEIDLDYEFDAVRFFDLSAQETPAQALQAELWFQSARSYPPSPFVARLVVREEESEKSATTVHGAANSNVPSGIRFPHTVFNHDGSKGGVESGNISALFSGVSRDFNMQLLQGTTGLTFSSKTISGNLNSKVKSAVAKGSTLMKPTASLLAKQNRPLQTVSSRFQKVQDHNNKKMNVSTSSGIECQAAKRQKLEGGLLHKVGDVKQQVNFVHKTPKKVATVDHNSGHSKLKITIPREPDLETAHRAQRIRPKNAAETEIVTVTAPRFKARPLNRKILDTPMLPLSKRSTPRLPEFQEFHLKTQERAMQHTSASSSSLLHCNDSDKNLAKHYAVSAQENRIRDLRRPSAMGAPKHDRLGFAHSFKARPLNKKILSSKGDIGVFRNRKQETTVPMEFNFHTEKRVQHNPPIELFSKMSLTSEIQSNNGSQLKLPRHSRVFREDSKENIGSSFHLDIKETAFVFGGKQIHSGRDGCDGETGTLLAARRSLGIR